MFSTVFVELLQSKKVSAYQLSKDTGIPQSLLSNYRSGKKKPTIENLKKIANYFNVTVEYLIGEENEKNEQIAKSNSLANTASELAKIFTKEALETMEAFKTLSAENQVQVKKFIDFLAEQEKK